MVVGRAMIRDLLEPEDAQRLMSLVTLFFGLAPAVAPIIGGWLFSELGWRSVFWFLAAVGFVLFVVSWRLLPETHPPSSRQPFHPAALLKGYEEVIANRRFLALSLAAGFNFNAFFLYICSAPAFLGTHLGLGPRQYAWLFIPSIAGIMAGAQLSGRAAGRLHARETVRFAYGFMATAAVANLLYTYAVRPSVPWAMVPIMVFAVGFAMAMPSITLITLEIFPRRRGMAASLQGFVSGMVNTLNAGLISPALSPDTRWLALGMAGMMMAGLLCWVAYVRMPGEAAAHGPPSYAGRR
jgi:DHA1 family bicyclomycin/chloramphenicol resistance-like MFS transporter